MLQYSSEVRREQVQVCGTDHFTFPSSQTFLWWGEYYSNSWRRVLCVCSQKILYGAQNLDFNVLFSTLEKCRERGVHIALSIDGTKMNGKFVCDVEIPDIFDECFTVSTGKSMLKRFQLSGDPLLRDTKQQTDFLCRIRKKPTLLIKLKDSMLYYPESEIKCQGKTMKLRMIDLFSGIALGLKLQGIAKRNKRES